MNYELLFFVMSLEWYSVLYIRIGGNLSVVMSATPLNRNIRLPNRHIRSAKTDCPRTDASIQLEQAQPF